MSEKPNCYECIHRRSVPGDAHSSCAHPVTAPLGQDPFDKLVNMMLRPERFSEMVEKLGIEVNPHGLRMGWAFWPANFDPVWLERCNGFTPASAPASAEEQPR